MTAKLTFEEWKDHHKVQMPRPYEIDDLRDALRDTVGVDMQEEIDKCLHVMYNNYLQEDNVMT